MVIACDAHQEIRHSCLWLHAFAAFTSGQPMSGCQQNRTVPFAADVCALREMTLKGRRGVQGAQLEPDLGSGRFLALVA